MRRLVTVLPIILVGCVDASEVERGDEAVLGGSPVGPTDLAYLAANCAIVRPMGSPIGSFSWGGGSGILIAPRLVLTVAHNGDDGDSYMDDRLVAAGTAAPFAEWVPAVREHDWPGPLAVDLGLWVLERPFTAALPYWNPAQLDGGGWVDFYGFSTGALTRTTDCEAWLVTEDPVLGARYTANCFGATGDAGDSGGPIFDESLRLVGLHANSWEPAGLPDIWNTMGPHLVPEYVDWIDAFVADYRTRLRTADADADGRADLVHWNSTGRESWLDRSEPWPDGEAEAVFAFCDEGELVVGDFDGAPGEDMLCARDALALELAAAAGGEYGAVVAVKGFCPAGALAAGDFDGDGLDDLLCLQTGEPATLLHAPFAPFVPGGALARPDWTDRGTWCAAGTVVVGRFESLDQRDDVLCVEQLQMSLRRGTATGLGPATTWATSYCDLPGDRLLAGDVDGIGRDDLVCWNKVLGRLSIDLAAATDGTAPVFTGPDHTDHDYDFCDQQGALADVTGNGKADFLCHDHRTGVTRIDSSSYAPHYLDGIENKRAPDLTTGLWP